ncbi:MAG: PAS domain-containing protein, partial [Myxococcota bacterium]
MVRQVLTTLPPPQVATALADVEVPLLGHDADGRLTAWNQAAQRLLGALGRDAWGAHVLDLFAPREHERVERALEGARSGRSQRLPVALARRADGEPLEVRATFSPVRQSGAPTRVALSLEDRRQERRRERELRAAREAGDLRTGRMVGLLAELRDALAAADLEGHGHRLLGVDHADARAAGEALGSLAARLDTWLEAAHASAGLRTATRAATARPFALGEELEARIVAAARRGLPLSADLDEALYAPVLAEGDRLTKLVASLVADLAGAGPVHVLGRVQAARE